MMCVIDYVHVCEDEGSVVTYVAVCVRVVHGGDATQGSRRGHGMRTKCSAVGCRVCAVRVCVCMCVALVCVCVWEGISCV